MANCQSSKKMIRVISRRTIINKMRRSKMRTAVKKLIDALKNKDAKNATAAFKEAEARLQKSVTQKIIHKNTASRKISNLYSQVKLLNLANQ